MIQTLWNSFKKLTRKDALVPQSYGISHPGLKREHNEDAIFYSDSYCLYLVADGMGGHSQGELASYLALRAMVESFERKEGGDPFSLSEAILEANRVIYHHPNSVAVPTGSPLRMGTTIVACYFNKGRLWIAHVGDSRAYRFRNSLIECLTKDHSLIPSGTGKSAGSQRFKNVITRAVGLNPDVKVDLKEEKVQTGDLILLCSDGLTRMVPDEEIGKMIGTPQALDAKCQQLITAANQNGGKDNISSILIQF